MDSFATTERTTLKRLPQRGFYDREVVYGILDEGFICHVGFVVDEQPFVIPTAYGRAGDKLYIHGSAASRTLRASSGGISLCVTVTLVDGLVLARSAFHHSINYRSVVILGAATMVEAAEEKMTALKAFMEHVVPKRWDEVREPSEQELKGTLVLSLPLLEVSAKVRTGPPKDDEEDMTMRVWAGELPLRITAGSPVGDPYLLAGISPPAYITGYSRQTQKTVEGDQEK